MKTHRALAIALCLIAPPAESQTVPSEQAEIPGVIHSGTQPQMIKAGFDGLEGPVSTPDGGLYFSAVNENRIYKLKRDGNIAVWRENTNRTNGLYLLNDGRLLCAEANGPRIISIALNGAVAVLATGYAGKPLRQPNDLIPDRNGGIYFTDPAPRPAANVAPKEPGNVHYIRPTGEVLLIDRQITRPNGITLSIDQKTLYVGDTEGEYVYAFDIAADGSAGNKRPFVKLRDLEQGTFGLRSRADGMAIDSAGRLYVGAGSGVQVIDASGRHLGAIRVPSAVRNVAFAGSDRHTLYMTTFDTLYRVKLLSSGPSGRAK